MKKNNLYIVIDIGGTNVRIASLRSLKNPKFERIKVFKLSHIFENDLNNILKTIHKISDKNINSIGVSLPGRLNNKKNTLNSAINIPEWVNVNIKDIFQKKFHCEVYLENDGVASALGEALYGNKKNNFLFIIWGTGIGGARIKINPKLKVRKLQKEDYIDELRKKCTGKNLLLKHKKNLNKLSPNDWGNILSDLEKLLLFISNKFKIKDIVIGGGIALKQKGKILMLSKKLKNNKKINLVVTKIGNHNTFGLYGAAALISMIKSNQDY